MQKTKLNLFNTTHTTKQNIKQTKTFINFIKNLIEHKLKFKKMLNKYWNSQKKSKKRNVDIYLLASGH